MAEPEFTDADKDPTLAARNKARGGIYGRPKPEVSWDPVPRFDASDEEEAAWAMRQLRSEAKRQGRAEKQVFKTAASGQSVRTENLDPVLQRVAQEGQQAHQQQVAQQHADRRSSFWVGLGRGLQSMSRQMGQLGGNQRRGRSMQSLGGTRRRSSGRSSLSKATKRRY